MYHVRLRGADISERVVRGSVSITGALGERRSASLRVRVPEGVTLAPADLDELTIDYPGLPYRAAADALAPVAYWALDEARGDRPLLSALPPLPPLRAREALPGRALVAVSLFDAAVVGGDTDPNISDATPGCLLAYETSVGHERPISNENAARRNSQRIPPSYVTGVVDAYFSLVRLEPNELTLRTSTGTTDSGGGSGPDLVTTAEASVGIALRAADGNTIGVMLSEMMDTTEPYDATITSLINAGVVTQDEFNACRSGFVSAGGQGRHRRHVGPERRLAEPRIPERDGRHPGRTARHGQPVRRGGRVVQYTATRRDCGNDAILLHRHRNTARTQLQHIDPAHYRHADHRRDVRRHLLCRG